MHKNVLAFIFLPSTAPRPTAPPRLSRSCTAPAICPQQHPPRLSRACHQARAPALIFAQFSFLTPLYFFLLAQGEVKKGPHTYPTFALSNPQSKMYARAVPTAHGRARVRTGAFSNYRACGIVRGRLVTAQAARAGVPLVIVGAAACLAAVLAAGVPPGVVCLGVGGVLAVGVGAGAGVAVVWCWLVSCCPVLLAVGGLLAGGVV